jgi:predicted murein hydrolase (TIGR00659 family)
MSDNITTIWVYLAETPLLWLAATLAIYQGAAWLYRRAGSNPLLNPVLLTIIVLVLVLLSTDTPYATYFDGAQFVHFLLGPATVALAVPLYLYAAKLRAMLVPLGIALVVGAVSGVLGTALLGQMLGLGEATIRSLIPRSVTTPIAMGIAEQIGGLPSLTAVLVILTGMIGAVTAQPLLGLLRIHDDSVRGFAIGIAAHGIGTARAFQFSAEAGAFAGLAMGLNGAMTTLLVPIMLQFVSAIRP